MAYNLWNTPEGEPSVFVKKLPHDALPITGATIDGTPLVGLPVYNGGTSTQLTIYNTPTGYPYLINQLDGCTSIDSGNSPTSPVDFIAGDEIILPPSIYFNNTDPEIREDFDGFMGNGAPRNFGCENRNFYDGVRKTINPKLIGYRLVIQETTAGYVYALTHIQTDQESYSIERYNAYDYSNLVYGMLWSPADYNLYFALNEPVPTIAALESVRKIFDAQIKSLFNNQITGAKQLNAAGNNLVVTKGFSHEGKIEYTSETVKADKKIAPECHYLEFQNFGPNICEINDVTLLPGEKQTYPVAHGTPLITTLFNVRFENSYASTGFTPSYKA